MPAPRLANPQAKELAHRIRSAERLVTRLTSDPDILLESNGGADDAEAQQSKFHIGGGSQDGADEDEGSDDDEGSDAGSDAGSVDAVEERFRALEEDVAILVADVHDLALFTKLNYTCVGSPLPSVALQVARLTASFLQQRLHQDRQEARQADGLGPQADLLAGGASRLVRPCARISGSR